MINYIIQITLFQILFLAVYDLFLSKETFFTKNRLYLISTAFLSFILPLLRIPTLQKAVPQEYTILLPEVVLSPQKVIQQSSWYESVNYLELLFWVGVVLFSIVFLVKLSKIIKLIFSNEIQRENNYKLVLLPKNSKAFSFFNYIFLGREIPQEKQAKIIQHELVHSKQKHSLDLLFFELLKIVMWFNPMIYLYQKRITLVHEFISDEVVVKQEEKSTYINNLLSEIFQVEHISFINQFYKHSFIKKRIIMMTKNKSKQTKQFKYLLLVPVLASMLLYTACANDEVKVEESGAKKQKTTLYVEMGKKYNKVFKDGKEKYLDYYQGTTEPGWEEITYNDLLPEEKEEYDEVVNKIQSNSIYSKVVETKLYKKEDGRKVMADIIDFSKVKNAKSEFNNEEAENQEVNGDVPFSVVDQVPTFPGCKEGDKDCLIRSIAKLVANEFDADLPNSLGLSPGKKRVYVQFKIDKTGNVVDIKARAPHPKLEEEAIRLAKKLPQFKPGVHNGRNVKVGYTLPITLNIQ